jgi:hypothetical protein
MSTEASQRLLLRSQHTLQPGTAFLVYPAVNQASSHVKSPHHYSNKHHLQQHQKQVHTMQAAVLLLWQAAL